MTAAAAAAARAAVALACLQAARGAGMTDEPVAASGATVYLDGGDWLVTSAPLPPAPPPRCSERCCFEQGVDWRPREGNTSGRVDANATTSAACCAACAAAPDCFVAVLSDVHEGSPAKCWLKTAEDAAGGSYVRGGARTSCQPGRAPAPPPPPPRRIAGSVPGDLLTDLQNAGAIPDPLFEDNFLTNASVWAGSVWTYSKSFTVPSGRSWLVFDGIKMGATIRVDGNFIGNATDQFRRLSFDVAPGRHTLQVAFDPRIDVDGRFMACTGGWDWAPYTSTYQRGGGGKSEPQTSQAATFTLGITKSVYVVNVAPPPQPTTRQPHVPVAITYFVPTVFYDGVSHPVAPLQDGRHAGFTVKAKLFLSYLSPALAPDDESQGAAKGVDVAVTGEWGATNRTTVMLTSFGESVVELTLKATAAQIQLWWPTGVGRQPLYNITAAVAQTVETTRQIGFRHFALVTGNDTDPSYVAESKGLQGSTLNFGMLFRVNGAAVFCKGANVIPLDEFEGRMTADAHTIMVESAVASGMNTLRVWGGGIFLPPAFYDACDRLGVMVYHDMQYANHGHGPANTTDQDQELRHNIRQLAHHSSVVIWDGCNECRVLMNESTAIYATFVLTVVAQEDQSRSVWPSCPAAGWTSGVDRLTSRPTGSALVTCDEGRSSIEIHGPYQHGTGFPSANDPGGTRYPFALRLPVTIQPQASGVTLPSTFASEFGCVVMSSFESMSALLKPEHWGLHAGMPADSCRATEAGGKACSGRNPMSLRNYPCDNLIEVFFGAEQAELDEVGTFVFQKQLWQCMISQALNIKSAIEEWRSANVFGLLVWQLNEIWPTGGWGSLEYGSDRPGQLLGGRWKPLHYMYKQSIFADIFATCGVHGQPDGLAYQHKQDDGDDGSHNGQAADIICYVKNDSPWPFKGSVIITKINLVTGNETTIPHHFGGSLPAGPGASSFFTLQGAAVNPAFEVLRVVTESAAVATTPTAGAVAGVQPAAVPPPSLCDNLLLFGPPKALSVPAAVVTANVSATAVPSKPSNIVIEVELVKGKSALYVTLTSAAPGRFSDNAFLLTESTSPLRIEFIPFLRDREGGGQAPDTLLARTLRVEHMALYR
jgi:beta-mannosidase